jgi:hypothetical protein
MKRWLPLKKIRNSKALEIRKGDKMGDNKAKITWRSTFSLIIPEKMKALSN